MAKFLYTFGVDRNLTDEALKRGVRGVIWKGADGDSLIDDLLRIARGEPLPTHGADHGGSTGSDHGELMPGMLDDTQMAELAAASGEAFDTLFLTSMIRHHEGAIAMVQALLDGGGGQEPAVFQLADGMSVDQAVEISRMKSILAELVPPE